jgi:cell division septum initiation protein DivIVA
VVLTLGSTVEDGDSCIDYESIEDALSSATFQVSELRKGIESIRKDRDIVTKSNEKLQKQVENLSAKLEKGKEQGINQGAAVDSLLSMPIVTRNNNSHYNCVAENCYQCLYWNSDTEQCSKGLTTGITCTGFFSLREELASAKVQIAELEENEKLLVSAANKKLLKLSPEELRIFYDKLREVIKL